MTKRKDSITGIYLLGTCFTRPGYYCVRKDTKGFNEYRFYDGKLIEVWPEGIEFVVDGEPEDDFVLGGLHWLLISNRVCQLFIESGIAGIQYLPVKVVHNSSGEEIGPYWAMHVIRSIEGLTWSLVDDLDIFRVRASIFVSNRIKKKLEQKKVNRGASFTRMPMELIDPSRPPK